MRTSAPDRPPSRRTRFRCAPCPTNWSRRCSGRRSTPPTVLPQRPRRSCAGRWRPFACMNTAVMNGNAGRRPARRGQHDGRRRTRTTSSGFTSRSWRTSLVDNLAVVALHERVFTGLCAGDGAVVLRRAAPPGRDRRPSTTRPAQDAGPDARRRRPRPDPHPAADRHGHQGRRRAAMFPLAGARSRRDRPSANAPQAEQPHRATSLPRRAAIRSLSPPRVGDLQLLPRPRIRLPHPVAAHLRRHRACWRTTTTWSRSRTRATTTWSAAACSRSTASRPPSLTSGPVLPGGEQRDAGQRSQPERGLVHGVVELAGADLRKAGPRGRLRVHATDAARQRGAAGERDVEDQDGRLKVRHILRERRRAAIALAELPQPGELTQGLCSPWQNDYRECACYYWAASRPDYVNVVAGRRRN